MYHHHYRARFAVCSPPPHPPRLPSQHGISTMQLHAKHCSIPPSHHSHYHSAPPHVHSHYYMPTQWQQSAFASRRSSSLSSQPAHHKRKTSLVTSPAHENRLQQEPFSVIKSFKSTVHWISKTFCFCYSDAIIEFDDCYYKKDEKSN
ncbi:hypothetical protein MAM1_0013c01298 [Mucor ambiguus]|uniref:Uncharacterized protein n=1 Tax=Mucor ambiguus TaxID=91626 RepID=A0A0C9MIZ1_9FUNG|nr:hypothetical protein MAM1_0013c01298 [Mucor ambiguus]